MKYTITIDMPEPKTCSDCPFDYDSNFCVAIYCKDEYGRYGCKHHDVNTCKEIEKWCPLKNKNSINP